MGGQSSTFALSSVVAVDAVEGVVTGVENCVVFKDPFAGFETPSSSKLWGGTARTEMQG